MTTTNIRRSFAATAAAVALAAAAGAQQGQERVPREQPSALLNGKKVTVEYGRPALKGRTLDELMSKLGKDRVWRAGENQVTKFSNESDILVGGQKLPAGKYTLYLQLPEGGNWHLLLNTDPGIALKEIYPPARPEVANELWPRLDGYEKIKATEVLRVPLRRATTTSTATDKFLITFEPAKGGVSAITFTWGDQSWTTDIKAAG